MSIGDYKKQVNSLCNYNVLYKIKSRLNACAISYVIYTDASFDDFTKIGTYAIIIMQGNKVLKRTAKRCRIQMKSATECETFAIYQALNIVLNRYVKNGKYAILT